MVPLWHRGYLVYTPSFALNSIHVVIYLIYLFAMTSWYNAFGQFITVCLLAHTYRVISICACVDSYILIWRVHNGHYDIRNKDWCQTDMLSFIFHYRLMMSFNGKSHEPFASFVTDKYRGSIIHTVMALAPILTSSMRITTHNTMLFTVISR